jgi:uncharacterized phage protein (TIGR02220 family)
MPVIRVNKSKDYVTMSNYHFKEKNMSLKAKGLLSEMLSLPDDWNYSIEGLVAINKENESAIKSALGELKEFGYLKMTKLLPNETHTGRIEYIYDIYEKKQDGEKQGVENLGVEILGVENPRQYNINNKIIKNKDINNIIKYIVEYLNKKAKTNYKPTTNKTKSLINARINEGFTKEDFIKVIDNKANEWLGTDMERYLRPETLFGTKFEGYLNQKKKTPEWFNKDIKKEEFEISDEERRKIGL